MTKKALGISQDGCGAAGGKRPARIWQLCLVNDISAPSTEAKPMADTACMENTGAVTGGVRTLLRLEGLTLFAGMTLLYAGRDGSWPVFAILFLAPDLSFAAYLPGAKPCAIVYNPAHNHIAPVILIGARLSL